MPDPADPARVGFAFQDGKVIVTTVPKGSPAEEAGAKVGDVLTQIDSQSVEGISMDEYCARYATGGIPETVTTASGATFPADRIEGFWASMD